MSPVTRCNIKLLRAVQRADGAGAGHAIREHGLHGIFFLGYFLGLLKVVLPIIIVIFAVITLFQLVTLPVEYDASRRAKEQLFRLGSCMNTNARCQ